MIHSMKLKLLFTWIFTVLIASSASSHKYHTSISKMEYNDETHSWEIIMNVFYQDWEKAVVNYNAKKVKLNDKNIDILSADYLKNKFQLKVNNQLLPIKLIGTKIENGNLKIFIEIEQRKLSKSISLSNTCMLENRADQINIVNIRIKEKTHTAVFQKDQKSKEINL